MINVRPIRADELSLFASIGSDAQETEEVAGYLKRMMEIGSVRPEWCFVAEETGRRQHGTAILMHAGETVIRAVVALVLSSLKI